jgi:phytoene dehydrogenase-like protein
MQAVKQALQAPNSGVAGSFRCWIERYTQNKKILDFFNATITSLLTVNIDECPAAEYFRMLKAVSPLRFGWASGGNIQIVEALAGVVRSHGGLIRHPNTVERIIVKNGVAKGVMIRTEDGKVRVNADIVVSNAGPAKTIELIGSDNLDNAYVNHIKATVRPTALIWIQFASNEPLCDYSAVTVSGAHRVNMIDTPTIECPGLAPPGKHLSISGGAPAGNTGPIDWEEEIKINFDDLRDILPGFDNRAEVLMVSRFHKDWPAYRTMPGRHLSFQTPIANLYNAGDATAPSGWVGTIGAAKSACLIADHVTKLQR